MRRVRVGSEGDAQSQLSHEEMMQLFDDETELTVRVLPDRSVADWFVQVSASSRPQWQLA